MAKKRISDADLMLQTQSNYFNSLKDSVPQAQNAGIQEQQPLPNGPAQSTLGFGQETEQSASTILNAQDVIPALAKSIWDKTKSALKQAKEDPWKEAMALGGSIVSEFQALGTDLPNFLSDVIKGGAIRASLKETEVTDNDVNVFGTGPNGEKLTLDEIKVRKRDFITNTVLRAPSIDAVTGYATRKVIGDYFNSAPDEKGDPTGFDKLLGVSKEQVVGKSIGNIASFAIAGGLGRAGKIPKLGQAFMFNMELQGYMDDIKAKRGDAAVSDPTILSSGIVYATISSFIEQKVGLNPLNIGARSATRSAIRKAALDAAEEVTAQSLGSAAKGGFLRGVARTVGGTVAESGEEMLQQGASDVIKTGVEYIDPGTTDNPLKGAMTDPKKQMEIISKYAENAVGALFGSSIFNSIHNATGGQREANNAAYDYIRNGVGDLRTLPQQVVSLFVPSVLSSDGKEGISARADLVKKTAIDDAKVEIEKIKGSQIAEEEKAARIAELETNRDKAISNIDGIANLAINIPSRVGQDASFQAFKILEKQKAVKGLINADKQLTGDEDIDTAALALNDSDIKAREELLKIYDSQLKEIGKNGSTTINKQEQQLLREVGLSEYADKLLDKPNEKVDGIVNDGLILSDENSFVAPNGEVFAKKDDQWTRLEKISEAKPIENVDPVTGVKTKEVIPARYKIKEVLTDNQDQVEAAYQQSGSSKRIEQAAAAEENARIAEENRLLQETKKAEDDEAARIAQEIKDNEVALAKAKKDRKEEQAAILAELKAEGVRLANELKMQNLDAKEKAALRKEQSDNKKLEAAATKAEVTKGESEIRYETLLDNLYQKQDEGKKRLEILDEKLKQAKEKTEQAQEKTAKQKTTLTAEEKNSVVYKASKDEKFKKFFNKLAKQIMYPLTKQEVDFDTKTMDAQDGDVSGQYADPQIEGFDDAALQFELIDGKRVFKYKLGKGIDSFNQEELLHFEKDGVLMYLTKTGIEAEVKRRNPGVRIRISESSLSEDGEQLDKKAPDLEKRGFILQGVMKALDSGKSASESVKEAIRLIYDNYQNGVVAVNIGDVAHIGNFLFGQNEVWSGNMDMSLFELFDLAMIEGQEEFINESIFDQETTVDLAWKISAILKSDFDKQMKAQLIRDRIAVAAFENGLLGEGKIRELKNRKLNEKSTRRDGAPSGEESQWSATSGRSNQENQGNQNETDQNGGATQNTKGQDGGASESTKNGGRDASSAKAGATEGTKAAKSDDVADEGVKFSEVEDEKIKDIAIDANLNVGSYVKSVPTGKKNKFGNSINEYEATNPFTGEKITFKKQGDATDYVVKEIAKANTKNGRKEIFDKKQSSQSGTKQSEKPKNEADAQFESLTKSPYSGVEYGGSQDVISIDDYLKQIGDIINEGNQGIAFSPEKEADRIYRLTVAVKDLALALIKEGIATINNVIKEVGKRVKVDKAVLDAAQEQLDATEPSVEQVKKLAAKMSGKFKGSKIKFFTDKDRNIDGIQLKVGEKAWGIKASDGTIYLNLDGISFEAAIHEFSHLWEAVYPSKFLEGVSLLKNTEEGKKLFNELRNNKSYDNLTDPQIWREALNTAIGRKGQDLFKGTKLMRFKEYLKSFFNGIGERFGIKLSPDVKLKDFLNLTVGKITNVGGDYKNKTKKQFMKLPDGRMGEIMSPEVVNGFYSPLEKIILETKFNKLPAKQWLEKFGKGDEAKWTGLADWLAGKGTVSKDEIQKFLKENRIQVVEVVKGVNTGRPKELRSLSEENALDYNGVSITNPFRDEQDFRDVDPVTNYGFTEKQLADAYGVTVSTIKEWRRSVNGEIEGETKYSQYQLEGDKSNYKEILVTTPQAKYKQSFELIEGRNGNWYVDNKNTGVRLTFGSEGLARSQYNKFNSEKQVDWSKTFKSSHFDEANILVHLRMNTRTDSEGNKVLFIEELQSDWGQLGKKEGFKGENFTVVTKPGIRKGVFKTEKEANDFISKSGRDDLSVVKEPILQGVAQAPFVTDTNSWAKLGLKVALKEAVKQGADKIAWTTGEQQNERYDLSKQVDKIDVEAVEDVDNLFFVDIKLSSGTTENLEVENGIIREGNYKGQRLDNVIGKDYADKILSTPKGQTTTLEGEYLKVGGKGMKGFYGSSSEGSLGIVGNLAKSLFKQTPGTIKIDTGNNKIDAKKYDGNEDISDIGGYEFVEKGDWIISTAQGDRYTITKEDANTKDDAISVFKKLGEENGDNFKEGNGLQSQYSIDITPELRQQVAEGLPLFLAYQFNAAMSFGDGRFESGTEIDLGLDQGSNQIEQLVATSWEDMLDNDKFDNLFDNFVTPIHEEDLIWNEVLNNEEYRDLLRAEIIDKSSLDEIKAYLQGKKYADKIAKLIHDTAASLRKNIFFAEQIKLMSPNVFYDEIENKFYKVDAKKEAELVKKNGLVVGLLGKFMGSTKQLDTTLVALQEPGGFLSKVRVMMQGAALDRKDRIKDRLKRRQMDLIDKYPELTNDTTERPIGFLGLNLSEAFSLYLQDARIFRDTGSRYLTDGAKIVNVKGDEINFQDYKGFVAALEKAMGTKLGEAKKDFEAFFNDDLVKDNMRAAMLVKNGKIDFKIGVPILTKKANENIFLSASFVPSTPMAVDKSSIGEGEMMNAEPLNEAMANHMSQVENFVEAAEYTHHIDAWSKKFGKEFKVEKLQEGPMSDKIKNLVERRILNNSFYGGLESRMKEVGGLGSAKLVRGLQTFSNAMSRAVFALNPFSGPIQTLGILTLGAAPHRKSPLKVVYKLVKAAANSALPVAEALTKIADSKKFERMSRHDVEDYLSASWLPFKKAGWDKTVAEMREHSPYLYGRLNNSFFEINELLRDSAELRGNTKSKKLEYITRMGRNLSIGQTVGDIAVIISEWEMSKDEHFDSGITVPYNGKNIDLKGWDAVAFAAKANVQVTQVVHDLSQVNNLKRAAQKGNALAQTISAFIPFVSENLKRLNMVAFYAMQKEAPIGHSQKQWDVKRSVGMAAALTLGTLSYKLLSGIWSSIRYDCGLDELDKVYSEVLTTPKTGIQLFDFVTNVTGAPPFVGQTSFSLKKTDKKTVKKFGDEYTAGEFASKFSIGELVSDLVTFGYASKIDRAISDAAKDKEIDAEEYAKFGGGIIGNVVGVPRTITAMIDCLAR